MCSKITTTIINLFIGVLVLSSAQSTLASSYESSVSLGVGPSFSETSPGDGPGIGGPLSRLQLNIGASDFVSITVGTETLSPLGPSPDAVFGAYGGARYKFDVFKYIPYLEFGVGAFTNSPTGFDTPPAAGFRAGLGLNQRYNRRWSFGAELDSYAFPFDSTSGIGDFTTLTVHATYHLFPFRW